MKTATEENALHHKQQVARGANKLRPRHCRLVPAKPTSYKASYCGASNSSPLNDNTAPATPAVPQSPTTGKPSNPTGKPSNPPTAWSITIA